MKYEPPAGERTNGGDLFDAAAEWHTRLDEEDLSPAVRAEFDSWLAAEQPHRPAFDAIDRMWSQMGEARLDPRIMEMRRKALNTGTYRRRIGLPRIAVAAMLVVLAGASWLTWFYLPELRDTVPSAGTEQHVEGGSLRTAVGQRSNVTLSDGSVVVLNTNSHVDIRFSQSERLVRLLSGQAWFEVAKNPNQPFIVEAGDQRVTALGTAFDVHIDEHKDTVQVTLVEGKVSVEPIQSPLVAFFKPRKKRAELMPGESLVATGTAFAKREKTDVVKIGSWRRGELVFDDDSLEDAVAEVNRYSATRIELEGEAIGAYRVSGVFKAGHSGSFVETVTGHYPIRVIERTDERIVLAAQTLR